MKIKIYWHILLTNHWREIVKEQLDLMKASGLYDACEKLSVGLVDPFVATPGTDPAEQMFQPAQAAEFITTILAPHHAKMELIGVYNYAEVYEYPTLEALWVEARRARKAQESFALMYFHAKGTSYATDIRKRWRGVLNQGLLAEWETVYGAMEKGYNAAGPNHLSKTIEHAEYFEGNFWIAQSDYVFRLPKPELIKSRFDAERWICTGSPSVLRQLFIPYE